MVWSEQRRGRHDGGGFNQDEGRQHSIIITTNNNNNNNNKDSNNCHSNSMHSTITARKRRSTSTTISTNGHRSQPPISQPQSLPILAGASGVALDHARHSPKPSRPRQATTTLSTTESSTSLREYLSSLALSPSWTTFTPTTSPLSHKSNPSALRLLEASARLVEDTLNCSLDNFMHEHQLSTQGATSKGSKGHSHKRRNHLDPLGPSMSAAMVRSASLGRSPFATSPRHGHRDRDTDDHDEDDDYDDDCSSYNSGISILQRALEHAEREMQVTPLFRTLSLSHSQGELKHQEQEEHNKEKQLPPQEQQQQQSSQPIPCPDIHCRRGHPIHQLILLKEVEEGPWAQSSFTKQLPQLPTTQYNNRSMDAIPTNSTTPSPDTVVFPACAEVGTLCASSLSVCQGNVVGQLTKKSDNNNHNNRDEIDIKDSNVKDDREKARTATTTALASSRAWLSPWWVMDGECCCCFNMNS